MSPTIVTQILNTTTISNSEYNILNQQNNLFSDRLFNRRNQRETLRETGLIFRQVSLVKTLFTASNVDFINQITGTPVSAAMGDLQCSVKSTLEVGLYKEYPVYRGLQLAMKERERILFLNILCLYCFS